MIIHYIYYTGYVLHIIKSKISRKANQQTLKSDSEHLTNSLKANQNVIECLGIMTSESAKTIIN